MEYTQKFGKNKRIMEGGEVGWSLHFQHNGIKMSKKVKKQKIREYSPSQNV